MKTKLFRYVLITLSLQGIVSCDLGGEYNFSATTRSNSAPIATGSLSFTASAATSSEFKITTVDAQGDALTVSVADKPEWLEWQLTNNQLLFTATPDFFDIGDYDVTFTLSDGQLSNSYQLHISVQDNTTAYQDIALNEDIVLGSWALQDGQTFHLFSAGNGLYSDAQEQLFRMSWQQDNDYQLTFNTYLLDCSQCEATQSWQMRVVAQKEGQNSTLTGVQQRWLLQQGDQAQAINASSVQSVTLNAGYYMALATSDSVVSQINLEQHTLTLNGTALVKGQTLPISVQGKLETDDTQSIYFDEPEVQVPAYDNFISSWYNNSAGAFLGLRFDLYPTELQALYASEQLVLAQVTLIPALSEEDANINHVDFDGLDAFLNTPITTTFVYKPLTPVTEMTLATGQNIASRFIAQATASISGINMQVFGANTLEIVSESEANLQFHLSESNADVATQSVSWSLEQGALTLQTQEGETHNYQLLSDANGVTYLAGYDIDGQTWAYPWFEVEFDISMQMTESDWVGEYQNVHFHSTSNLEQNAFILNESGRADLHYSELVPDWQDRWKYNSNNSINMVYGLGKCSSYSVYYDECFQEQLSNYNESVRNAFGVRHYQMLQQNNDMRSLRTALLVFDNEPSAYPSVQRWYKVP
ncbi:hypothetical protein KIH87_18540 [Paraneptunicella aestuarii]|uniref:Ig-like domain-containing protein n=1 Tax=Paraneptunicella aestuarii TaxID=2831148 RepID=UPI001E545836|nr:hypothetical protein [Paraneptunicella aestuarii]UAA38633.1 hypothetical protein KIH87_18540 [Paraneptunicella aestuarii]